LHLGTGSTWPGHLALKTDSKLIRKVLLKNTDIKIVLVAGTNGKTTTTKALTHILENNNISVLTNQAGANLLNGLASLLVKHATLSGKLKHKALIFEVDESSLPLVLCEIPNPNAIILLNLFRDQLDRYGEVNSTAEKWEKNIKKLSEKTFVIANADDPLIAYTAAHAKSTFYFTIDSKYKKESALSHAVDSTICPNCKNILSYSTISYSHLGNYMCQNCGFTNPKAKKYEIKSQLSGDYNIYNLSAAVLAADKTFGINPYTSLLSLVKLKPAFGRQEIIEVEGRKVMVLLSKNPTGMNQSLKVAKEKNSTAILLLLNDRIPDGRDISWIWDVDFEVLKDKELNIFVSGDRAYDLANRLLFAHVSHEVFENFEEAYREALKKTPTGKQLTILPTYSAMLEIRKLISGKSIL
jgi:UDP-N-acetylmuramyl tripeptide synthase